MIKIIEAIYALYPEVCNTTDEKAFDINGNEVIYDKATVEAYVAANAYKDKRVAEYPSFADQFDTIFHEGLDAWKTKIQSIKDKYPKGA